MIKKLIMIVMIAVLIFSSSILTNANEKANAIQGTPIIDGIIDEIWANAEEYQINKLIYSVEPSSVSANFRLLWDNNNLYILIKVIDSVISSDGEYNERDGVRLIFNPRHSSEDNIIECYITAPSENPIVAKGNNSIVENFIKTARKAFTRTDNGYIIEASFDMSSIVSEFAMASGNIIGFNIQANDQKSGNTYKSASYTWTGSNTQADGIPELGDVILLASFSVPDKPIENEENEIPYTTDIAFIPEIIFAITSLISIYELKKYFAN